MNDKPEILTVAKMAENAFSFIVEEPALFKRWRLEREAKRAAWWASLSRWQKFKWHVSSRWGEVWHRVSHAWDALCGRECDS